MRLIDDYTSDIVLQLHQLHAKHFSDSHFYLLVDGAFDNRWFLFLKSHSNAMWHALFEGRPGADDQTLEVSPLIMAYEPNERVFDDLLRNTSGRPMLSVIITKETLAELAARLAPWCVAEIDDSRFNFRFADTRRLPTIIEVLDENQHGQFFGPATAAYYVARDGTLTTLTLPKQAQGPAKRIKLSNKQYSAMVADSEADELLDLLSFRMPGEYEKLIPSERHRRVTNGLTQAYKYGASEAYEKEAICRLALEYSDWESVPLCARLVNNHESERPSLWESIADCMRERNYST